MGKDLPRAIQALLQGVGRGQEVISFKKALRRGVPLVLAMAIIKIIRNVVKYSLS